MDSHTKPKFKERFANVCRTRHLSLATERSYWDWCARFIKFHAIKSELELLSKPEEKFSNFISSIKLRSSALVACSAIKFFYRHVVRISLKSENCVPVTKTLSYDPPASHRQALQIIEALRPRLQPTMRLIYFDHMPAGRASKKSGHTPEYLQVETKTALKRLGLKKNITPGSMRRAGIMYSTLCKGQDYLTT